MIGLTSGKNIQVLRFNGYESLTIGRNRNCDMQVNDASISQHHAIIKKSTELNEFILMEDQSKFGVLKLI